MDPENRLNLQKMINANNVEDMTDEIRKKKHSVLIKNDLKTLLFLKRKHSILQKENPTKFETICITECQFLFNNYTDIFNKVRKDEIDLKMLHQFLEILKDIEDGSLDQHTASFKVGTILKEIYIDSALKKSEKLDKEYGSEEVKIVKEKNINWLQWKMMNN
jgi:hypothetical protein